MDSDSVSGMTVAGAEPDSLPRKPGAGRRRDPSIDDRLRCAARTLYAREGWAGFHFEGVAKAAGVSKDAVYRRYRDAQSLLIDSLSDQCVPVLSEDGPIEKALLEFACDTFTFFAGGSGYANLRVHLDAPRYPEILEAYRTRVLGPQRGHAVGVLEKARDQGRLDPDIPCVAVVEALGGAVMVFAMTSVPWDGVADKDMGEPDPMVRRRLSEYVTLILNGSVRSSTTRHRRPAVEDP